MIKQIKFILINSDKINLAEGKKGKHFGLKVCSVMETPYHFLILKEPFDDYTLKRLKQLFIFTTW